MVREGSVCHCEVGKECPQVGYDPHGLALSVEIQSAVYYIEGD